MFKKIIVLSGLVFTISFQMVLGANASWDLNTAGEYTVSDAAKVEVADGVGKLIGSPNHYPTVQQFITPTNALAFTSSIATFGDMSTVSAGHSVLLYYVSSDNGATWKCWDHGTWEDYTLDPATNMCTDGSLLADINDNIATLDTDGGQFLWKAVLQSYGPADEGEAQVELDQVNITYDVAPNVAPVISSNGGGDTAAISINENTTAVTTVTATDDPTQTLTYSIANDTAPEDIFFEINPNTGVLSFKATPDFEDPQDKPIDQNGVNNDTNTYVVEVKVEDDQTPKLSDTQFITVTVLDVVNEAPNVAPTDITIDSDSINENNAVDDIVGNLTTVDADSNSFDYTLVDNANYPDNTNFGIDHSRLVAKEIYDFETKNSYTIKIKTDDKNGGIFEKEFVIRIVDLNEHKKRNRKRCRDLIAVNYSDYGVHDASKCIYQLGDEPDETVGQKTVEVVKNPILFRQYTFNVAENITDIATIDEELSKTKTIESETMFGNVEIANLDWLPSIKAYDIDQVGMNLDNLNYDILPRYWDAFDGSKFEIKDRKLVFKSAPDYENPENFFKIGNPNKYKVAIKLSNDSFESVQVITVNVTDKDDTCEPFKNDILTVGNHDDARALQHFLNTYDHGRYKVAITGRGSLDQETPYFGRMTQQALRKFQLHFKSQIFGNASLDFFGEGSENTEDLDINHINNLPIVFDAKTRAKVNQLLCIDRQEEPEEEIIEACREIPESERYFKGETRWNQTSSEVKKLQHFLNTHGFPIAQSGVGSLGHETNYYGNATVRALGNFQSTIKARASWGYLLGSPFTGLAMEKAEQILCEERQNGMPTEDVGEVDVYSSLIEVDHIDNDPVYAPYSKILIILKDSNGNRVTHGGHDVKIFASNASLSKIEDHNNGIYTVRAVRVSSNEKSTITATIDGHKIKDKKTLISSGDAYIFNNAVLLLPDSFAVKGKYMYLASQPSARNRYTMSTVLLTEDETKKTHIFAFNKNIYDNDGISILNITDLDAITEYRKIENKDTVSHLAGASKVFINGDYLYLTSFDADNLRFEKSGVAKPYKYNLEIFKITSEGGNIIHKKSFHAFDARKILDIVDGKIFVDLTESTDDGTVTKSGIAIYSIKDNPENPRKVSEIIGQTGVPGTALAFPSRLVVRNNMLYVLSANGFEIVDISDIEHPIHKGALVSDYYGQHRYYGQERLLRNATSFEIYGNYAFVAISHGVMSIDIADPQRPSIIDILENTNIDYGGELKIKNNVAYILSNKTGARNIIAVDIANPSNLILLKVNKMKGVSEDISNVESQSITLFDDEFMVTNYLFDLKQVAISHIKMSDSYSELMKERSQIDLEKSLIEVDEEFLMADGVDSSGVLVTLKDYFNKLLPTGGDDVQIAATNDANITEKTDQKNGLYSAIVKSDIEGMSEITAKINGKDLIYFGDIYLKSIHAITGEDSISAVVQYGSMVYLFVKKADDTGEIITLKNRYGVFEKIKTTKTKFMSENIIRRGDHVYLLADGIYVLKLIRQTGEIKFVKKLSVKPSKSFNVTTKTTTSSCIWFFCDNDTETKHTKRSLTIGKIYGYKKFRNTLYVYGYGGFEIYDLSDKENPKYVKTIFNKMQTLTDANGWQDDNLLEYVTVIGNKAFAEEVRNMTLSGNELKVYTEEVLINENNVRSAGLYHIYTYDISEKENPILNSEEIKIKIEVLDELEDVFDNSIRVGGFTYQADEGKLDILRKKGSKYELVKSIDNFKLTKKTEFRKIADFLILKVVNSNRGVAEEEKEHSGYGRDVYHGNFDLTKGGMLIYDVHDPANPIYKGEVEVVGGLGWRFIGRDSGGNNKLYLYSKNGLYQFRSEQTKKIHFVKGDINAVNFDNSKIKLSQKEIVYNRGSVEVSVELKNILNKAILSNHAVEIKYERFKYIHGDMHNVSERSISRATVYPLNNNGVYQVSISAFEPALVKVEVKVDGVSLGKKEINFLAKERILDLSKLEFLKWHNSELVKKLLGEERRAVYKYNPDSFDERDYYDSMIPIDPLAGPFYIRLIDSLGDKVMERQDVEFITGSDTASATRAIFDPENGTYSTSLATTLREEKFTLRVKVNGEFSPVKAVIGIGNDLLPVTLLKLRGDNPEIVMLNSTYQDKGAQILQPGSNNIADMSIEVDDSELDMVTEGEYNIYYTLKSNKGTANEKTIDTKVRKVIVSKEKLFYRNTANSDKIKNISMKRLDNNRILAIFTDFENGKNVVKMKMITNNLETDYDATVIKAVDTGKISRPQIIERKDGNILILFGTDKHIYGQVINKRGELLEDKSFSKKISSKKLTFVGVQRPIHPYGKILNSGSVLVVYEKWPGGDSDIILRGRVFNESGDEVDIVDQNGVRGKEFAPIKVNRSERDEQGYYLMQHEDAILPKIASGPIVDNVQSFNIYLESVYTVTGEGEGLSFKDNYGETLTVEENVENNSVEIARAFAEKMPNVTQVLISKDGSTMGLVGYDAEPEYMMLNYPTESLDGVVYDKNGIVQNGVFSIEDFKAVSSRDSVVALHLGNGNLLFSWVDSNNYVNMRVIDSAGRILKSIKPFTVAGDSEIAVEYLSNDEAIVIRKSGLGDMLISKINIAVAEEDETSSQSQDGDSDTNQYFRAGEYGNTNNLHELRRFDYLSLRRYDNILRIAKPSFIDQ